MKHLHNFWPLPEVEEIELELEYDYYHQPAKTYGLPENCYPAEEECEINLPKDYKEQIRVAYLREAETAITMIEAQVQGLLADNAPAQWAVDDAPEPDYDDDWNDYEEAA